MCESVEADRLYEVVVVGAGVQGSSTAYYLAKKLGVNNVLLLEQVRCCSPRCRASGLIYMCLMDMVLRNAVWCPKRQE